MSFDITVSGAALEAVDRIVPQLVSDLVASRIAGQDPTLWGAEAEAEAARRLGWTEAVVLSDPLVPDILALRDRLHAHGVDHIVLGGMGGSSLAPEVITRTAGVELTILDTTSPGQIAAALADRLATTAVVISSKSGSTVETDSHKRVYEKAFRDAGIDPIERIVVVTDPGSPLDVSARADGYRVFNADPSVGGRYSALTAFGLVPSGLAGVDIAGLLDDASSVAGRISVDQPENPALILGAAIAGTRPLRNKLGIVADGTYIVGFADWAEQLIAESTGKQGKGILPVVLEADAPELSERLPDLHVVRLVESARATDEVEPADPLVACRLVAPACVRVGPPLEIIAVHGVGFDARTDVREDLLGVRPVRREVQLPLALRVRQRLCECHAGHPAHGLVRLEQPRDLLVDGHREWILGHRGLVAAVGGRAVVEHHGPPLDGRRGAGDAHGERRHPIGFLRGERAGTREAPGAVHQDTHAEAFRLAQGDAVRATALDRQRLIMAVHDADVREARTPGGGSVKGAAAEGSHGRRQDTPRHPDPSVGGCADDGVKERGTRPRRPAGCRVGRAADRTGPGAWRRRTPSTRR